MQLLPDTYDQTKCMTLKGHSARSHQGYIALGVVTSQKLNLRISFLFLRHPFGHLTR